MDCKHGIPLVFCAECYVPRMPACWAVELERVRRARSMLRWVPRHVKVNYLG